MSGPPSECPPQNTFRRRTARLGISLVRIECQSRTVCSTPTLRNQFASTADFQPPKVTPSTGRPFQ